MNKLDIFHYHEALDRTHVAICLLEEHLLSHPVVEKHSKLNKKNSKSNRYIG